MANMCVWVCGICRGPSQSLLLLVLLLPEEYLFTIISTVIRTEFSTFSGSKTRNVDRLKVNLLLTKPGKLVCDMSHASLHLHFIYSEITGHKGYCQFISICPLNTSFIYPNIAK